MGMFEGYITGKKLAALLEELKEKANRHHALALSGFDHALEEARKAGEALQEAYERLGRAGRWGRWLRANFNGSPRTARQYRQIYRNWNDPRIVAERKMGTVCSIGAVLRLLRSPESPDTTDDSHRQLLCKSLCQAFGKFLCGLSVAELEILDGLHESNFGPLHEDLRLTACVVHEVDDYGGDDPDKAAIRRRMTRLYSAIPTAISR